MNSNEIPTAAGRPPFWWYIVLVLVVIGALVGIPALLIALTVEVIF
ncbi:hypothetical protein [Corynebacterium sp.]|nr:hypothetical protein [Corynebacterium sp.]